MLGLNAKQRQRLATFRRLVDLQGCFGLEKEYARPAIADRLEDLVLNGGKTKDITECRRNVARLLRCALPMRDELLHLIEHPDEASSVKGFERGKALELHASLRELCRELEARAGQPNESKSKRAERMRQKLEKKLVPQLQVEIPRWAEKLRFMQAEVLKWRKPKKMLEEPILKDDERAAGIGGDNSSGTPFKEWEAPPQDNPEPSAEELELLKAMGWRGSD